MKTIAFSLALIAAGAILKFAITTQVSGINLQTIGVILMAVGGGGLLIGLGLLEQARSDTRKQHPDLG